MDGANKDPAAGLDAKPLEARLELAGTLIIVGNASDAARLGHILGKYAGELERECLGLAAAGPRQDDAMPLRLVSRPLALIAAELFCQP
jgi:hypothetical protein